MANALVEAGHQVDILTEAPARRFIDEPLLDAPIRRVLLGKGILAGFRLRRYVGAHPGVRVVAALVYYNLRAASLQRRSGDQVPVLLTKLAHSPAAARCLPALKSQATHPPPAPS